MSLTKCTFLGLNWLWKFLFLLALLFVTLYRDTPEEKVEDMEQGDQGSTVPDPCIIPPVVHVQYYDSDHAQ